MYKTLIKYNVITVIKIKKFENSCLYCSVCVLIYQSLRELQIHCLFCVCKFHFDVFLYCFWNLDYWIVYVVIIRMFIIEIICTRHFYFHFWINCSYMINDSVWGEHRTGIIKQICSGFDLILKDLIILVQ